MDLSSLVKLFSETVTFIGIKLGWTEFDLEFKNGMLHYLNKERKHDPLKFVKKIGGGYDGGVYKISNKNESYALKQFDSQGMCDREAHIFQKLDGIKNIPKMYEDLCKEFKAIQMELIEGQQLRSAKFEYAEAWKEIYPTIVEMGNRGVYHNDLLLKNMMKSNNSFWVVDFARSDFLDFTDEKTLQKSPMFEGWSFGFNSCSPQAAIMEILAKERYHNNVSNIKADEEFIKKLAFELNAYHLQKELMLATLSKEQRHDLDKIEVAAEKWSWWAETAKNSAQYSDAHKDHPEEKYLIHAIEEYTSIYSELTPKTNKSSQNESSGGCCTKKSRSLVFTVVFFVIIWLYIF